MNFNVGLFMLEVLVAIINLLEINILVQINNNGYY
jgi:hypothetical protein